MMVARRVCLALRAHQNVVKNFVELRHPGLHGIIIIRGMLYHEKYHTTHSADFFCLQFS